MCVYFLYIQVWVCGKKIHSIKCIIFADYRGEITKQKISISIEKVYITVCMCVCVYEGLGVGGLCMYFCVCMVTGCDLHWHQKQCVVKQCVACPCWTGSGAGPVLTSPAGSWSGLGEIMPATPSCPHTCTHIHTHAQCAWGSHNYSVKLQLFS